MSVTAAETNDPGVKQKELQVTFGPLYHSYED